MSNKQVEMSFDEDRILIENILKNEDRISFEKLISKYKKMVFNLCYSLLYNREDAEDCAQDVFVKVFNNLKGLQFKSGFSTWLYRIAINVCKNKQNSLEYRLRKKQKDNIEDKDCFYDIKDNSENTAIKVEIEEENNLIRKIIANLPLEKRTLIILRDIENRSYEEITEITGMKIGTVKSGLARARKYLKIQLKEVLE
jgi:RNA polymerase sigma-70 factor, ECF subfamily